MQDILSSLAVGLHKAETIRTASTLGDRSRYVGMSDIGKAADCLRAAVIGKLRRTDPHHNLDPAQPGDLLPFLAGKIRLQRGHWFESGIAEAFRLSGQSVLHQMSAHVRQNNVPIVAHLDFVLVSRSDPPRIRIVEMKSCERMPDTAYAAHEVQVSGQTGLLETLWNKPCFMAQPGPLRTFPELVRKTCNITLPEQPENAVIEGVILMVSMSGVNIFGPYSPNAIMTGMALSLAGEIWDAVAAIRAGTKSPDDLPVARGFHPLCDYCEWNGDCPKFAGMSAPEMERDLLEFCGLKDAKEAAVARVREMEAHLKRAFRDIGSGQDWANAVTQRFRVGIHEGRKILDRELLLSALTTCMTKDEAEAVVAAGYKTGEPHERLYVSPINGG
jgi:hypothetical protein